MLRSKYLFISAITGMAVLLILVAPMFSQSISKTVGFISVTPVYAQTTGSTTAPPGEMHRGMGWGSRSGNMQPGVFGTVSAVSGNTLTVTGKVRPMAGGTTSTSVTYTIDASQATITKNGATSAVSSITVGDNIMARGTVSGTNNVVATSVRDNGNNPNPGKGFTGKDNGQIQNFQGNGQPVVSGNVTAINGSVINISNKSNVAYSVDATNAVIHKGNATSTIANISVGDSVIVQGTVNGTAVTASSVIDSGVQASANANTSANANAAHRGFLGGIFGFFQRLFGF